MKKPDGVTEIAFGSCLLEHSPQPIWKVIRKKKPDLFVFLGDNIYADTTDSLVMREKYAQQVGRKKFQKFRKRVPIVGTWDDHDFAYDDAGGEIEEAFKRESKKQLLRFLREPAETARRKRDGVYTSYMFGKAPHRVQLILLDLRWWRGPLDKDLHGAYLPAGPSATLLGEEQWRWLEHTLLQPAEVRILGSSIQLVSSDHAHEKWANFPHEKERLFRLIDELRVHNLVVISGDMHFAELSAEFTPGGTAVYDLTSSGLNRYETIVKENPNSKRLAAYDQSENFGYVTVLWDEEPLNVRLEVCDIRGECVITRRTALVA